MHGVPPGWLGGGAVALVPSSIDAMRKVLAAARPSLAAAVHDAALQLRAVAMLRPPPEAPLAGKALGESSNDLLQSATFDEARSLVLEHGCAARPAASATARARPLNWLLPASEPV